MNEYHSIPFGCLDNNDLILFFIESNTISESYILLLLKGSLNTKLKINKQKLYKSECCLIIGAK